MFPYVSWSFGVIATSWFAGFSNFMRKNLNPEHRWGLYIYVDPSPVGGGTFMSIKVLGEIKWHQGEKFTLNGRGPDRALWLELRESRGLNQALSNISRLCQCLLGGKISHS